MSGRRLPARSTLAALALILLVLGLWWPRIKVEPLGVFDQPFYLGIAQQWRQTGRFTDGYMFATPGADGRLPVGMRFTPLYPALLTVAASLDARFAGAMRCEVATHGHDPACSRAASLIRWTQFAMLAGFFLLVWRIGLRVTARPAGAWIALVLALPTAGVLLRSVNDVMTETTSLLLFTAAVAAALASLPDRWKPMLGAGVLLGLASLTHPDFLYLAYATILAGAALVAWRRRGGRLLAAHVLGLCLCLSPWLVRNLLVFGRFGLTYGYASHTLVQRIAYDEMSWREYGFAFLCGLPDGTGLGHLLAGPGTCGRFALDLSRPDTFYAIGMGPLMQSTLRAAGGWANHLHWLLTHEILAHPIWHIMVSVPLALRGAYIDHDWGLVLLPVTLWATARACRRGSPFLPMVVLPALFVLAFNAAVAVNQTRYNLVLIPGYAVSGAVLLLAWIEARRARGTRAAAD